MSTLLTILLEPLAVRPWALGLATWPPGCLIAETCVLSTCYFLVSVEEESGSCFGVSLHDLSARIRRLSLSGDSKSKMSGGQGGSPLSTLTPELEEQRWA